MSTLTNMRYQVSILGQPYIPHIEEDRLYWFYGKCHSNARTCDCQLFKKGRLMLNETSKEQLNRLIEIIGQFEMNIYINFESLKHFELTNQLGETYLEEVAATYNSVEKTQELLIDQCKEFRNRIKYIIKQGE